MLTPIQALTSALLTALIVQFLTLKFTTDNQIELVDYSNDVNDHKNQITNLVPESNPIIPIPNSRIEEPEELNKLLDAIFVSHGTEDKSEEPGIPVDVVEEVDDKINEQNEPIKPEIAIRKQLLHLDAGNFDSIYTNDWLILAYTPWYPQSLQYLQHFQDRFTGALTEFNSTLKLGVIDCQAHPRLAALLNVRSYPSLHLVTTSGRLREWPFPLTHLNQQSLRFLLNAEWRHLPVYQLLQLDNKDNPNIFLNEIQIKFFNNLTSLIVRIK